MYPSTEYMSALDNLQHFGFDTACSGRLSLKGPPDWQPRPWSFVSNIWWTMV